MRSLAIAATFAWLWMIGGCQKSDSVVFYEAPKEPPQEATAASQLTEPAPTSSGISWTLPAGWKQVPSQEQMRFATIQVSDDPAVITTVSTLPASDLLSNVNRWRGQLGMQPIAETELPKSVSHVHVDGLPVDLIDLVSPGEGAARKQMLAAILTRGTEAWFFKLTGPFDVVSRQKDNFQAFVSSVRFDGKSSASAAGQVIAAPTTAAPSEGHPPLPGGQLSLTVADSGSADGIASWNVPADWQRDPAKPMRVASFRVGPTGSEIIVTRFAAGAFGGMLDNINRWRGQVGLPAVDDVNTQPAGKITVDGKNGSIFDFEGTAQEQSGTKRLRVAMITVGEDVWFLKLQGPASAVKSQVAAFDAFVQSIKFTAGS